ncbi:MAG TPA: hypothetical protein DCY64_22530 [Hydrogenophaga sp.]|uniref:hypothetical protein n=1 Tax=Hydrogenophaga sp. TaxID=1904254 RepID=UPI0008CCFA1E|nr:hypothetical protein [Hydrogenophaga sp.]OGA78762.1 MAG: hypothetical protein A2X73_07370 [Burkholderiales bacterium GWE1_65_30]OGA89333.1 MAG: hypothetical protein A2X72_16530 [Burkholderiales bacterium GWF1_66_17]HAX23049.1 hypothetical protein [Hydrogenophaga sp.]HBU17087.1 hypothetical protein [Hydrogenophaga sp.]
MNEDPNAFYAFLSAVGAFILKIVQSHFFIGLLGAIVSLRGVPGSTWKARYFNVFCGMVIAGACTAGLSEWMSLKSEGAIGAMAFALGLFGLNLVDVLRERAVEMIRTVKLSDFIPWKKGD